MNEPEQNPFPGADWKWDEVILEQTNPLPDTQNCRCVLLFTAPQNDWLVELEDTMDIVIGNTHPLTAEHRGSLIFIKEIGLF